MPDLFASILPLAVASSLSPIILAVSISLLARKDMKSATAFLIGGLLAAAAIAAAGVSIAEVDDGAAEALGLEPRAADLFFGVIFLAFGLKVLFEKPSSEGMPQGAKKQQGAAKWVALGFLGNITNFDAVLLNLGAVRQIFNAAIPQLQQFSLLAFCDFFFLAPSLVPLALYALAPSKAERALEPVGKWMSKYGHYLVGAIFMFFGLYLCFMWLSG